LKIDVFLFKDVSMRTTIAIDDDVLAAAKGLAALQHESIGTVISALVRQALRPAARNEVRNGIMLLPVRADSVPVTLAQVNQLRDELL
jgi:Arc/MetJ family transcription regulator